jgi:hypothetical protein
MRNLYKILVGKPEGRRPLRRPRHKEGSLWTVYYKSSVWSMSVWHIVSDTHHWCECIALHNAWFENEKKSMYFRSEKQGQLPTTLNAFRIWGSYGGEYEDCCLLPDYTVLQPRRQQSS